MPLLQWIKQLTSRQADYTDLLNRVVSRSQPAIWSRVLPAIATMDPPQARGYIRARGILIIRRELEIAAPTSLGPSARHVVLARATEAVIKNMVLELASRRPDQQLAPPKAA